MKIGILTYGFSGWGGGIDFIRHMLTFLDEAHKSGGQVSTVLILPKDSFLDVLIKKLYPFRNLLKQLLKKEKLSWRGMPTYSQAYLLQTFSEFIENTEIAISGSSYNAQLNDAIKLGVDIVFPCIKVPPKNFKLPWIGYIPDFQHLYLPNFFTKLEIESRNIAFANMLHSAQNIIVYGKEVILDADRFYPGHTAKLHALPFCPCPQKEWVYSSLDVREEYGINSPYFLISNQFWVHKDHGTAFRAFAKYCQEHGSADLVCTGEVCDYRFPAYAGELFSLLDSLGISKRVKILGHIPKIHQISLLKNSLAVVQATLFEGGPGGGSSYDAVSLGVPVIASNIAINLEIDCGDIVFFKAGNFQDLSRAMHSITQNAFSKKSNDELWKEGVERKCIISNALLDILKRAI